MADEISFHYRYESAERAHTAAYLWAPIVERLRSSGTVRVLDLGCGNGAFCAHLSACGFEVVGCDPSEDGVRMASAAHPELRFCQLGVYDDPSSSELGQFDAVVAVEVVEHLLYPRHLMRFASRVLSEQGLLILTTPYHGYLKNLALSIFNRWDFHWSPGWDGGHVKFWSQATLSRVLSEEGFVRESFAGAGRVPYLWKSMILTARRA